MTNLHALTFYDLPTKQEKSRQSAQITSDIAEFESRGGKIQILGDTQFVEKSKTLRQVFQDGAKQKEKRV